ncbi:MAG: AmmeMemoRadiSam system radical SAM enzyme [Deltaproteobacteria bacterium]|nr:AmmeMemoRadiSam system radical SAM enzyme [Deltaproteobacteria bacterium]
MSENRLQCLLCPHRCVLKEGDVGRCGTRKHHKQRLQVLTHGRFSAVAVDPVEKKPLSHYRPGTLTYSLGTAGCNMICPFCQNASLSQCPATGGFDATEIPYTPPEHVVRDALNRRCQSISFTYSEPILALEYALEIAPLAQAAQLDLIFVTNGQVTEAPLHDLCRILRAANVDLKSFQPTIYKRTLGGELDTTLNTIRQLHQAGVWVEVTTLIVPGMNDSDEELTNIAEFIAGVAPSIPWHVSRFHPAYKSRNTGPTAADVIYRALEIGASAGLEYVYAGNLPGQRGENTYCPNCKDVVVDRTGYRVRAVRTQHGACARCGYGIAGVGFS